MAEKTESLSDEEITGFKKWIDKNRGGRVKIMVSGKCGAGKSSLLNFVFGTTFKTGDGPEPCTEEVTMWQAEKKGITLEVFDCPGLQDGTGNEEAYLRDMVEKCKDVDVVLYCISMQSTRSDLGQEASTVSKITKAFGAKIWKNAIVCLTFANIVERRIKSRHPQQSERDTGDMFQKKVREWSDQLKKALEDLSVQQEVINHLMKHICPTGHSKIRSLPGQEDWITEAWVHCVDAMRESAKPLAIQMEIDNFIDENDPELEEYKKRDISPETRKIILSPKVKAALGLGAGSGAAVITGATIGALIGTFTIGLPTFGAAAGAGLVIGGTIGAGAGLGVSLLVGLYMRHKKKKILSQ